MIYKFTSSTGRTNYGVIIEPLEHGAVVLMDEFDTSDRSKLPARIRYVTMLASKYAVGDARSRARLPIETDVRWEAPVMAYVVDMMRDGKWEQWWSLNKEHMYYPQEIAKALQALKNSEEKEIGNG